MKVILCGKGGCGKSTVSALIAGAYSRNGKNVLVVDTDESNFGLHKQLGLCFWKNAQSFYGFRLLKNWFSSIWGGCFMESPQK